MEGRRLKGRLAHALPELVWLNDDVHKALERSRLVRRPLRRLAALHRRRLDSVLVVAVTGSTGKSTTRKLITAVLRSRFEGTSTWGNANADIGAAKTLLRTSQKDDFSVLELGTGGPGMLRPLAELVRPRIGVVTAVSFEHLREFRSRDAIAAEKGVLVQALPADGVAVLNRDDPYVLAMAESCAGRIVTVGVRPDATFGAEDVVSAFPDPLSFTLRFDGAVLPVRTSLYGRHWVHAVLAALAVGVEAGVPLADGIAALEDVETSRGRMQPVVCADGVTFIRDDFKFELLSAFRALEFVEDARAARKVVVIGRITNFDGNAYSAYAGLAKRALQVADEVIFTGPESRYAPKPENESSRLRILPTVKEASEYLRQTTRPGDLVLLKAGTSSHLGRVILAHTGNVACWLSSCGRKRFCESCELLDLPSEPDSRLPARLLARREQPSIPVEI